MDFDIPIATICPSCNSPVAGGAKYCAECGARIVGAVAASAPPRLVERKFVTVVFIDMVGSLSIIRDKDPEDAHELLESAMAVMSEAVHAYGGVVADRLGDGIMAIFGAPVSQDDHATRACHAALRLHFLVERSLGSRIALRVGMNSGEVAVGSALNDFAANYTATGAVVHIAARLQGMAAPNATVMTAQTAALVRDVMRTEAIGRLTLKGLEAPLDVHRLIGPIAGRDRFSPEPAGSAFLGRAAALAVLDQALAAALDGRGSVVGISGEAGIGKTTLIERFAQRQQHAVTLVRGTAEHYTSVAPFQLFAEVLLQLLGLGEVPVAQRRAEITARLAALGLDHATCEAPLLDLLDLDGLPPSWDRLAPVLRHDLIGSAVIEVLLAESRRRKLLVVLDDVQRADASTIHLVNRIIPRVGRHQLLVVVAFRPELVHHWAGNDNYAQLRLERLSDDDTRALIAGFFGQDVLPRLEQQLLGWSKGNPLFLRESVRALVEAGALANPDVAAAIAVPASIGAVIAARIDRLPPAAKRVLRAACVLGEQFAFDILASVSGTAEAALAGQLEVLTAAQFIRPLDPVRRTYAFEHGLFQEVGYAALLRRQRRSLHQAAFVALRRSEQSAASVPVEELAHHAHNGELWTEAVPLCREAGRRAAARYSNREAALHLEHAIAALGCADPDALRLEDAITLRLELRTVSIPLLRLDRIGAVLAEADAMAGRLGDLSLRARISAFQAGHAYMTSNPARCISLCRAALRLAGRAPDPGLRVAPQLYLAQAHYGLGQYRRVVTTLVRHRSLQDAALSGAAVGLPVRPALMRGYWLAIAQAELGRFAEAEALAAEMLAQADEHQPFESLYALTAQGFIWMLRGELQAALRSSTSALAVADHNDITFIIPVLASQVGLLLASQGRAAEGLALARRAMHKAEEIGVRAGRSRWCARLAETCLLAGNLPEARENAEAAIRFAEDGGERGYLCSAQRLRAKTRVADADLDGAAHDLARATAIARSLQLGPALAKCQFDAGALAHRAGRLTEARRAFRIARNGFARYQMQAGMARADHALAQLAAGSPAPPAEAFFGSSE